MEILEPKLFNLSPKTVIQKVDSNTIAIVKNRKSRIIMKDGEKILEQVEKIKGKSPEINIIFRTTAPVCSKTRAFLKKHDIEVESCDIV